MPDEVIRLVYSIKPSDIVTVHSYPGGPPPRTLKATDRLEEIAKQFEAPLFRPSPEDGITDLWELQIKEADHLAYKLAADELDGFRK